MYSKFLRGSQVLLSLKGTQLQSCHWFNNNTLKKWGNKRHFFGPFVWYLSLTLSRKHDLVPIEISIGKANTMANYFQGKCLHIVLSVENSFLHTYTYLYVFIVAKGACRPSNSFREISLIELHQNFTIARIRFLVKEKLSHLLTREGMNQLFITSYFHINYYQFHQFIRLYKPNQLF